MLPPHEPYVALHYKTNGLESKTLTSLTKLRQCCEFIPSLRKTAARIQTCAAKFLSMTVSSSSVAVCVELLCCVDIYFLLRNFPMKFFTRSQRFSRAHFTKCTTKFREFHSQTFLGLITTNRHRLT